MALAYTVFCQHSILQNQNKTTNEGKSSIHLIMEFYNNGILQSVRQTES